LYSFFQHFRLSEKILSDTPKGQHIQYGDEHLKAETQLCRYSHP
jgi:hypothetical protein